MVSDLEREFLKFLLSSWRVLIHLTRMWAPGEAKKISPLANCSEGLKVVIVCGTRLEILKMKKRM